MVTTANEVHINDHENNRIPRHPLCLVRACHTMPGCGCFGRPLDEQQQAVAAVMAELGKAREKFPDFNSAHEGFAVLLEEVDELWEAVRQRQGTSTRCENIRREAEQVAAMAIRVLTDCLEARNV